MIEARTGTDRAAEVRDPAVVSILQDSRNRGGIETVNEWYRRWMERHRAGSNIEIYLDDFAPSFAFARSLGRRDRVSGAIPRLFPRLHVPQYLAGRVRARRFLEEGVEAHVLGGVAVHGYLAAGRCPMLIWIGTTIGSERRAVIPLHRPPRRWLHRATLPALERLENRALRDARRVLVQSPATADDVLALGIPSSSVELRPVPIDTDQFYPDTDARRGMLFVGRALDPRKNFGACIDLLTASSIARGEGLDVVSEGQPPSETRDLGDAIRWRGRVEDVAECHRRAKLFLLPSVQEGLGIVVLEALASGTPVVALSSGGPDRFIRESGGGAVVHDVGEFRDQVKELLRDDDARRDMGAAGRSWCEENVSARAFLDDASIFRLP